MLFIYAELFLNLTIVLNMKINAILNKFLDIDSALNFPIHLGFEMKENFYIRILYWKSGTKVNYGLEEKLYEFELYDLELKKNQKKSIVKHLMNRLNFKFAFGISDNEDRFYIKKINSFADFNKTLKQLYAMLDQQIGLTDKSKPITFFENGT